ncbi:DUF535 domain-containing protein [Duganella sp. FT109W]|uniref:DUF535 domain-containing protein n=1 Tax=Duganella margarita TaxID=2692170 RepID=A0ABW9WQ59_9BURK|nr:DUF535 family protein [Duganella margarita]MYN42140.1 DUF535 domain-containing protein [Duganella margarita]
MTQTIAQESGPVAVVQPSSPARHAPQYGVLSQALDFTMNLRSHFVLSRWLRELGALNSADFYDGVRYRYLRKYYLGGGFNIPHRLRVAINHHQQVAQHFRTGFLTATNRHGGHTLWKQRTGAASLSMALRFPYRYNFDGDLCLTLNVNSTDACILTFSIVPGEVAGVSAAQALLVSSVQGIAGSIDRIRLATEECNNVSPAHLLLMAAETLAMAIGIKVLAGIGQSHMPRMTDTVAQKKLFDYDAFWAPLVGAEAPQHFYHMALPFADKPIEAIPAKHRGRARKRRELRNLIRHDIQAQASAVLARDCLR